MNKFTITFRNAMGDLKTEELVLNFFSVQAVFNWFEDTFATRPQSISKH